MKGIKVPVEVYSRVVGYFRPVVQWNNGKRDEFKERAMLQFDIESASENRCSCSRDKC